MIELFTTHPNLNRLTYIQHLTLSLRLSLILGIASIKAFIHSIFPFIFTTSTSDTIEYIKILINK